MIYPFFPRAWHYIAISHPDLQKPASMFTRNRLLKNRRRAYRSIRKNLGCTDYRQDLMEVRGGEGGWGPVMTLLPVRPVVELRNVEFLILSFLVL